MKAKNIEGITKEDVQQHVMLYPLLVGILEEMRELSKKKQDGLLNELKAKTINRILQKVKYIQRHELTLEFLDPLDEETLPSNSDAVLHIVQFKAAMEAFKNKYYKLKDRRQVWETAEGDFSSSEL